MNINEKVQWIFESKNVKDLSARYDNWSNEYDQDLPLENYISPELTVNVLTKYVPQAAKILDAGAGTGLLGQVLSQRGYKHLEALDLSVGMLEKAKKKNIYTCLHQGILGTELNFSSNSFDAVASVGTFTIGHAPSNSFDELIRITKPEGYIVFTIRPEFYENSDFKEKTSALSMDGQWTLIEAGEPFQHRPKTAPETYLQIKVYQVC